LTDNRRAALRLPGCRVSGIAVVSRRWPSRRFLDVIILGKTLFERRLTAELSRQLSVNRQGISWASIQSLMSLRKHKSLRIERCMSITGSTRMAFAGPDRGLRATWPPDCSRARRKPELRPISVENPTFGDTHAFDRSSQEDEVGPSNFRLREGPPARR